jgi:hypothetical protein
MLAAPRRAGGSAHFLEWKKPCGERTQGVDDLSALLETLRNRRKRLKGVRDECQGV